jgi:hypothetical protein
MTYRYDNIHEGIVGRNPAARSSTSQRFRAAVQRAWSEIHKGSPRLTPLEES